MRFMCSHSQSSIHTERFNVCQPLYRLIQCVGRVEPPDRLCSVHLDPGETLSLSDFGLFEHIARPIPANPERQELIGTRVKPQLTIRKHCKLLGPFRPEAARRARRRPCP
jgi:hypothetical protein